MIWSGFVAMTARSASPLPTSTIHHGGPIDVYPSRESPDLSQNQYRALPSSSNKRTKDLNNSDQEREGESDNGYGSRVMHYCRLSLHGIESMESRDFEKKWGHMSCGNRIFRSGCRRSLRYIRLQDVSEHDLGNSHDNESCDGNDQECID